MSLWDSQDPVFMYTGSNLHVQDTLHISWEACTANYGTVLTHRLGKQYCSVYNIQDQYSVQRILYSLQRELYSVQRILYKIYQLAIPGLFKVIKYIWQEDPPLAEEKKT